MNIRLKSLTVQDYRCFGGAQTVRLAPITLLVGENSSGKTSLLAMIRALWNSTFTPAAGAPDFKEDLGSMVKRTAHPTTRRADGKHNHSDLAQRTSPGQPCYNPPLRFPPLTGGVASRYQRAEELYPDHEKSIDDDQQ